MKRRFLIPTICLLFGAALGSIVTAIIADNRARSTNDSWLEVHFLSDINTAAKLRAGKLEGVLASLDTRLAAFAAEAETQPRNRGHLPSIKAYFEYNGLPLPSGKAGELLSKAERQKERPYKMFVGLWEY